MSNIELDLTTILVASIPSFFVLIGGLVAGFIQLKKFREETEAATEKNRLEAKETAKENEDEAKIANDKWREAMRQQLMTDMRDELERNASGWEATRKALSAAMKDISALQASLKVAQIESEKNKAELKQACDQVGDLKKELADVTAGWEETKQELAGMEAKMAKVIRENARLKTSDTKKSKLIEELRGRIRELESKWDGAEKAGTGPLPPLED